MSYNNPNHNEVIQHSSGKIGKHYGKSYHNLAKSAFLKKYNRKPTLDDAQAIRDLFEEQWLDWYTNLENSNRDYADGKVLWQYGVSIRVDVKKALEEYAPGVKYPCTHIQANNLAEEFKIYMYQNRIRLRHIPGPKSSYQDFSDLAYNGVTDDF